MGDRGEALNQEGEPPRPEYGRRGRRAEQCAGAIIMQKLGVQPR
jgi:hypothetical protein